MIVNILKYKSDNLIIFYHYVYSKLSSIIRLLFRAS